MEQSQLFELITVLDPTERAHVLEFAQISFFTRTKTRNQIITLLHLCFEHNPANGVFQKQEVYRKIYGEAPFISGKLEKLMVEAHKLIRSFLLTQFHLSDANNFLNELHFTEIARKRGLKSRHKNELNKLERSLADRQIKDSEFFYHQFLTAYAFHDHESMYNQVKGDLNIPNVLKPLTIFYHTHQLALLNRLLLQQKVANVAVDAITDAMLLQPAVPKYCLEDSKITYVFHVIFEILKKRYPDPCDAELLFGLLKTNESAFNNALLREFYTYLRNICVLILNDQSENEAMYQLLFELYKDNLERGYLHYEGKLHPSRYLAISEYAARVKKHDWAFQFIETYKDHLIGDNESKDFYRLNYAYYLFAVGRFDECLDYIPGAFSSVDYHVSCKRLELKVLYELQSPLLEYKLDAFKMFLSRTSQKLLSDQRRQMNVDFANALRQLWSAPPHAPKRTHRIQQRLHENRQLAERHWLLGKLRV